jgi:hypothetical protein
MVSSIFSTFLRPTRYSGGAAGRGAGVRTAVLVLLGAVGVLAAGCNDTAPGITATGEAASEAALRRDCANPKWKDENLGLWYSVCRQPMHW